MPTDEQLKKVLDHVDEEFGLFPFMILYTGLRRAELMALQWDDIDWRNKTIQVNKSVYFVGNNPHIKVPKTPAGFREVFLLDDLAKVLPQKKGKQYIFGGEKPMSKSEVRRKWTAWCKTVGLATQTIRSSGKKRDGSKREQSVWSPGWLNPFP